MGHISVGNIRTHKDDGSIAIRIDRRHSVLGNIFYMSKESERDLVCDQYERYFNERIKHDCSMIKEVCRIKELSKNNDITLLCWCAPKRCHGDTIKRYVEGEVK